MAVTTRRKSKSERGDTLTIRLSAKMKFSLELLAQKQGTTLSSIVMNAIEGPLHNMDTGLTVFRESGEMGQERVYIPDVAWDPLEPDRMVKLAMNAPELLTDHQQVMWKIIKEAPEYWVSDDEPNFKVIRTHWQDIKSDADRQLDQHGT